MPAAKNPEVGRLSATLAITTRHHGPDHPRVHELRRDLNAVRLADHIRAVVDAMPPLTAEQRDKLAVLLAPAEQTGGAADGS